MEWFPLSGMRKAKKQDKFNNKCGVKVVNEKNWDNFNSCFDLTTQENGLYYYLQFYNIQKKGEKNVSSIKWYWQYLQRTKIKKINIALFASVEISSLGHIVYHYWLVITIRMINILLKSSSSPKAFWVSQLSFLSGYSTNIAGKVYIINNFFFFFFSYKKDRLNL